MTVETEDILDKYRINAEIREENLLHSKAALSKNHERHEKEEVDHRMPYKRDVDRIIHSKAYSRYVDKTQVVYLVQNDHITHRSLHVQLVNNFAKGVAEILGLNLDLVEAISLGHDVGHPPFGHEGEEYLNELSIEFGQKAFLHPVQSCRLLTVIEPLNLGLTVYDGFLCHDGGMKEPVIIPKFKKTWSDHYNEIEKKVEDPDHLVFPTTLEGCLVRLSDTISYLGRDIEDAISIGILNRNEVPTTILGIDNKTILTCLAQDIIRNSYGKDYIAISDEIFNALKVLRKFNFEKIYHHPKLKVESQKIKQSYRVLFEQLIYDFEENKVDSYLWNNFLINKPEEYLEITNTVRFVIDYISGMTDNYFVKTLQNVFVPSKIQLHD